MSRFAWTVLLVGMLLAAFASADVIIFVDGSRMEIQSYEIKGALVLMTTLEGRLRSVPLSYVNMEATKRANRGDSATSEQPRTPPQPPRSPETRTPAKPPGEERPKPTPPQPPEKPPAKEPSEPTTRQPEEPKTEPPVATPPTIPSPEPTMPPPVWTDEELQASLVIPSTAWTVETQEASFDVAVRLDNPRTEARATLALIRRRMRNYDDFQKVIRDVESSLVSFPNYQPLDSGPLLLDPYTAHEFRYLKTADGTTYYSRMVVYYSRDLAYVLSLTCPEDMLEQSEADFDALVRGLVIKKVRKDITPKGGPKG